MLRELGKAIGRMVGDRIRFRDGTEYRVVNRQGTLVRDPRKLRGKAAVKTAKRMRHAK